MQGQRMRPNASSEVLDNIKCFWKRCKKNYHLSGFLAKFSRTWLKPSRGIVQRLAMVNLSRWAHSKGEILAFTIECVPFDVHYRDDLRVVDKIFQNHSMLNQCNKDDAQKRIQWFCSNIKSVVAHVNKSCTKRYSLRTNCLLRTISQLDANGFPSWRSTPLTVASHWHVKKNITMWVHDTTRTLHSQPTTMDERGRPPGLP